MISQEKISTSLENLFILLVLCLTIFNFIHYINIKNSTTKVLSAETSEVNGDRIEFWQRIIGSYPTYRDGYLVLSKLYLTEGKLDQAEKYFQLAQIIDPNSQRINDFSRIFKKTAN